MFALILEIEALSCSTLAVGSAKASSRYPKSSSQVNLCTGCLFAIDLLLYILYNLLMDDERKQAIASKLRALIEDLNREEEELTKRAHEVHDARCDFGQAWLALGLGPRPGEAESYEPWREVESKIDPEILKTLMHEDLGITERIRLILQHNPNQEMSPTEVRDLLIQTGFEVKGRNNPLAEVHMILKRIADKPKSRVTKRDAENGTLYKYNATPAPFWDRRMNGK